MKKSTSPCSKARRAFSANYPDSRETYVTKLVATFRSAFEGLQISNATLELSMELMSNFIYESMSTSARNYHHVQHVFDVIEGEGRVLDAVAILAALFHDCIYANIDGGLSRLQRQKLAGAIVEEVAAVETENVTTQLRIVQDPHEETEDKLLSMVMQIFGLDYGEVLNPGSGGNEFLSAVIAVRELQTMVPFADLVKIAVCIEATIPFRPNDGITGESALEKLYGRLCGFVQTFNVDLSKDDCLKAVQRACLLANEDIGNFATSNHALFIDKTWSLLPESNAALRQAYTIFEFHHAVFKMYGFFQFVKADLIYQQFRGTPSDTVLHALTEAAAANISVGRRYLAVKLVSSTFLAALAQLSGGDAPISLFMGELPNIATPGGRLEQVLELRNIRDVQDDPKIDMNVYRLLAEGRLSETAFDVKQSPLSAYFYGIMGNEQVHYILEKNEPMYPMSDELGWKFLKLLPRLAVVCVASLIAEKAAERREKIQEVLRQLDP